MILLLDNFDSFTYNLVDYFNQLGIEVAVFRNDIGLGEIIQGSYSGLVLSPGPENPESAGCLMDVIAYYEKKLPVLGICLGHQAIGQHFGAGLEKANKPMHGKISTLEEVSGEIFEEIVDGTEVVRYHSLILSDLPEVLEPLAFCKSELMAFQHKLLPITGLQFHPEAVMTQHGMRMLSNWVRFNNIV